MPHFFFADTYYLLIVLAIFEGPILSIVCGIGAGLGYLNPLLAYGILIAGDLIPDVFWYWVGRWGAQRPWVRRFASRQKFIRENFLPLERLWQERPTLTLASAKLAYGIAPALVASAGLSAVPFPRFVWSSLLVSTIYLGLLAAAGYGFARAYGYVNLATGNAPVIIGLGAFLFFMLLVLMVRYVRRNLKNAEAAPESNLISNV